MEAGKTKGETKAAKAVEAGAKANGKSAEANGKTGQDPAKGAALEAAFTQIERQ